MQRRTLLRASGAGLVGLGLGACSARPEAVPDLPLRPALRLPPVKASPDRVIRTTVGLRPHRPSGFVLRAARLDNTTVIHNYGHGGAGLSLSWGCGLMATRMALSHGSRRAAVIGCGAVGLAAARQLQRHGFSVTIYAKAVPPDTTSNMAWAGFTPGSWVVEHTERTAAWDARFREATEISWREYQWLAGRGYGVSWIDRYSLTDVPPRPRMPRRPARGPEPLLPERLTPGRFVLGPGEHNFPTRFAVRRSGIRIEPAIYLDAVVADFLKFGGRIRIRRFTERREITALPESLVVNCTGLGAKELFGDEELMPIKGQLTVLVPQPEIHYGTSISSPEAPPGVTGISMQPREDGIILGTVGLHDDATLEPNEAARDHILAGLQALFEAMH